MELNKDGELHFGSPLSVGYNSDTELYDWEIENYESMARESYSILAIPKKSRRTCCSMSNVPKIFEKKIREVPSLIPTTTESKPLRPLRYNERESPSSSYKRSIKRDWRPRSIAKLSRDVHRPSCSMVGHSSFPSPKLDDRLDILCRTIWRKIDRSRRQHSQIHSRSRSRSTYNPMRK